MDAALVVPAAVAVALLAPRVVRRLQLSLAKHPSLAGHPRIALRLSRLLPFYEYGEDEAFGVDGAPAGVVARRRQAFDALSTSLTQRAPKTLAATAELAEGLSDVAFTGAYRVPFPFRRLAREHLPVGALLERSRDAHVEDLDGNVMLDLSGSYGTNLFGYDHARGCIERATHTAAELGPVLGAYHPVIVDNVRRLRELSGLHEVSFHMSGTEAVMQAVRLARYHTRRPKAVRFAGAYHGWWDGVQAGPGNPRPVRDTYTLRDMHSRTLGILRTRRDIACVLVNPLQALHPNGGAAGDGALLGARRDRSVDREAYAAWLRELRAVCTERDIALIFDEVFLGFRIARGGAQEAFGVRADMVTYGKALGGGYPVGVVCGTSRFMKRFRDDRPSDICFARGTFNSHPYVMAAMHEFLKGLDEPDVLAAYDGLDARWDTRAASLNARLDDLGVPVRVAHLGSVWSVVYTADAPYHWLFQSYLRAEGLHLSWVGTGRFIFPIDFSDDDMAEVEARIVAAARRMSADGWWWRDATSAGRPTFRRLMTKRLVQAFTKGRALS